MSKHYYVATFFVALICISMVLGGVVVLQVIWLKSNK